MTELYLLDDQDPRECHCDNCSWTGLATESKQPIVDAQERLEPGEEIPIGECPLCCALAYITKDKK